MWTNSIKYLFDDSNIDKILRLREILRHYAINGSQKIRLECKEKHILIDKNRRAIL